ncbi:MAG TPA: amidohydrolase family protein [Methylomirabilota bacterium]|jgi:predicted TIM-barrel fold metal-dependent hydrolase|nr:amidohydrolase family protein [Methylomirabilota bacterium]
MRYTRISADCHVDLPWLPPDLFTSHASAAMKDRMPYVTDGPKGPVWVTKKGAAFGLMNGMGAAGREYVPGQIHRSDRMASTGLYEDGQRGIRRLTDPELRLKDQERDGVQAEVLYGILGATRRLNDPEAAIEVTRIYNEWLADFCETHPDRYAGLACIPNHPVEAAVEEVTRVVKRGGVRGIELANSHDIVPLWDPQWVPLWEIINEAALPLHIHTVGGQRPDFEKLPPMLGKVARAVHITGFQMHMATILTSLIFAGVLERYPRIKVVIGESGIGWIPYVLERMDAEWEDQFKDLTLTMRPSEYWRRQCKATYQTDRIGIKLLDELGHDTIMWGSDFPHPDGVWPDSGEFIQRELGHLPAEVRQKIVCENAGKLYGFI